MASSFFNKVIAVNRRARHDYLIEESLECGVVLAGSEVKSIKSGHLSFPDAFAEIKEGEVWLRNFSISEYKFSSNFAPDSKRYKKLLLHSAEIKRLDRKCREKGYTMIPLSVYSKNGLVKVELGLCKGKKQYDKRADIRSKDIDRDTQRELSEKNKYF